MARLGRRRAFRPLLLRSVTPGAALAVSAASGLALAGAAAALRAEAGAGSDALALGDLAAASRFVFGAATDGLALADSGSEVPDYAGGTLDTLHLGDSADPVRVLPRPAADALHLGDSAAAIRARLVDAASSLHLADLIVSPATYARAAADALHLADGESAVVITDRFRSAATALHLGDLAAAHIPVDLPVVAGTVLELRDHAAARDTHVLVAAADALALADDAPAHDGSPRVAATRTLHLADRAEAAPIRGPRPLGLTALHLGDAATAARDLHVAASSGLGLSGPDERAGLGRPVAAPDALDLDDAGWSNGFLAASATSTLVLDAGGELDVVMLGAGGDGPQLRLGDRADARRVLADGGGPACDAGSGLRDVLLAGLDGDFPVSFAETPAGLILIANGVDPMVRWDGLSASASAAGVAAPASALALGGFGAGTITGAYTAYHRHLDADGNPSNLSPVSNGIVGGSDGPVEGVTYDPATGLVAVRSAGHGLADGAPVVIAGVEGLPAVNGTWPVAVLDADTFRPAGPVVTGGAYTAGGTWSHGIATIAYSGVAPPSDPKVVRRQILRNLDGDATVYYVDVDTADLVSDTFFSVKDDEALAAGEPVPILYRDESPHANRFGMPPSHKACLAAHLGRIFAAGEVTDDRGSIAVAYDSPVVRGIGTAWKATYAGRLLYAAGATRSHEIAAVDEAAQTITLAAPFTDPTGPIAGYAIRPAPGERRLVYYSEPSLPESWPAWNAVAFPEDGDEVTGLMIRGSFLYVLERRHIYRFTFQADPNLDGFAFLATRRGCVNHRCQVQAEDTCYLLDEVGVHAFDGQSSKPISTPIQPVFQRGVGLGGLEVNWDADRTLWHAAHDPVRETIRWFVAMAGWREPRHALCYDYRLERWWIEEYPSPITASATATVGHRRSLAGTTGRRVLCLAEGTLDGVDAGHAFRGAVASAGPLSLTAADASFDCDLAGTPVQVVAGKGADQSRTVTGSSGSTLRIDRPWRVRPDATSTFQLGGVPWRWRSGWYAVAPDEGSNPRDLELVYQPARRPVTADARVYFDHAEDPERWAIDVAQDGVAVAAGEAAVRFALDTPRGHARHRLTGHADPYGYGAAFVSVQLSGVQASEQVRVFSVVLKGAIE